MLDHQAGRLSRWMTTITIFLIIGGFVGFKIFDDLKDDAQRSVENARASGNKLEKIVGDMELRAQRTKQIVANARKGVEESQQIIVAIQENARESSELLDVVRRELERAKEFRSGIGKIFTEVREVKKQMLAKGDQKNNTQILNDLNAYNQMGFVKLWSKQYKAAIADYAKVIEKANSLKTKSSETYARNWGDAKTAEVYKNRGKALAALRKFDKTITDYTNALELKKDAAVYKNRGNAKAALKNYQGSIDDYDEAINQKTDFASAYYDRGKARAALKQKDQIDKAKEDFRKAIKLASNDGDKLLVSLARRALRNLTPRRPPRYSGWVPKPGERERLYRTPFGSRFLRDH